MPSIFGNHMVLQGGISLPVWGTAEPGEEVTVSVAGQNATTTADDDGEWKVVLDPLTISDQPTEMSVIGKNTIHFTDVLVGDVWLCSGQSNMQMGLKTATGGAAAIARANYSEMRFFKVEENFAFEPQGTCRGEWRVCSPEMLQKERVSAVAFFFGEELYHHLDHPIGLLVAAWGGTAGQLWTSVEALQSDPILADFARKFLDAKEKQAANVSGGSKDKARVVRDEEFAPKIPAILFNGMINPLIPFGIKGVVWYQGESNTNNGKTATEYFPLLSALVKDWRARWDQGDFPFLIVQLAGFEQLPARPIFNGKFFPELRNSQRKALALPNTGMAVTLDIGERDNIHPKNKQDVGRRLALAARGVAYGEEIVYSGPLYESMSIEGNKVRLQFTNLGGGLVIGRRSTGAGDPSSPPWDSLAGFDIAGADGNFVSAEAQIDGDSVLVWNDTIASPSAVRYAWKGFPDDANLYNKEGLPTAGFSTE